MFTLQIGNRTTNFLPSLADVSAAYEKVRAAKGAGASRMPEGKVFAHGGEQVGRVSYNGRIWPVEEWHMDQTPIYDNRLN